MLDSYETLHGTSIYTNQNYGNLRDKCLGDVAQGQFIGTNFCTDFRFYERIVDIVEFLFLLYEEDFIDW